MQKLARTLRSTLFTPYGLACLGDIVKTLKLQQYVSLGEELREAQFFLDALNGFALDAEAFADRTGDLTLFSAMSGMRDLCRSLDARQMERLLSARIDHENDGEWLELRPKSWEELGTLIEAFKKELEERLFLYLPTDAAPYYQSNKLLSSTARSAFPRMAQEVRSAGTAYAVGLPTASIFHCMRAVEFGIGALARELGLVWGKEQWHSIIEKIESKIEAERRSLPKGTDRDNRLKFLSEVAKEFYYFKDGWRNYVAHNKINYDAPQAMEVMNHVRAFAEKLATELSE